MSLLTLELALIRAEEAGLGLPDLIKVSSGHLKQLETEADELCSLASNDTVSGLRFRGIPVEVEPFLEDDKVLMTRGDRTLAWKSTGVEERVQGAIKTVVVSIADFLKAIQPGFAQGGPVHSRKEQEAFGPGSYPGSEVILPPSKACTRIPAAPVPQWSEQYSTYLVQCPRPEEG